MGRQSGLTGDEAYTILHKKIEAGGSGAGGTSNYNDLSNKPKIVTSREGRVSRNLPSLIGQRVSW